MHVTAPSLTGSEVLSMSPPPSYSIANNIGGVLGQVLEVDTSGERITDVIDVKGEGKTPISPASVLSTRSEAPSPAPSASTAQSTLDEPDVIPAPLPSPARSSSFATSTAPAPSQIKEHVASASKIGHVRNKSSQSSTSSRASSSVSDRAELPRLMTVSNTFVPTLDDELSVRIGDTVRMLEEFKDGWCTVQHLGKFDAPRGVVPRVCLQERRSIVPTHKGSTASLSGSISGSYRH
ncbi:hypothetical protein P691DRAFT_799142 [Macrolepiota fuliginosa MF-IS2]|uniref:SH3 domain-containing protein n=1 Tax=Macrolepiota fuliginosa MF-IS2 TaxID=1400762 RepID=A0A9P5XGY4_9AGAR|nr:hypothetical protein P691DRAFT_799142 [Macrolepiota fuliginosa MF-IS2]